MNASIHRAIVSLYMLVIIALSFLWQKNSYTLSDQRVAVDEGQNPFPIYVAINLKESYSAQDFRGNLTISSPLSVSIPH